MSTRILRIATGVALFVFSVGPAVCASTLPEGPQPGTMAPDFTGKNLMTGEPVTLSALRGKLVIVTFWATWCAPCRRELPILEKAQILVGKDRLEVLAVDFGDTFEAQSNIKKALKQWHVSFLSDSRAKIAYAYKIKAVPHLFMIDREGKVVANHLGYGDSSIDQLVADLNQVLPTP